MIRRPTGAREAAEAAFKAATAKPARLKEAPAVPGRKEQITLRLNSQVLEQFQEEGPGWQERINDALRKAVGL